MSRRSNEKHRKKQKKKAKERSARERTLVGEVKALISETKRAEARVYELRRLGKISEQEARERLKRLRKRGATLAGLLIECVYLYRKERALEQEALEQGLSQDIEIIEGLARRLESERREALAEALTILGIQKQNAPTK